MMDITVTTIIVMITGTCAQFLQQSLPFVPLQPSPLITPQSVSLYPTQNTNLLMPRRGAACIVSGFQMQNNLDLRSFMGQWLVFVTSVVSKILVSIQISMLADLVISENRRAINSCSH